MILLDPALGPEPDPDPAARAASGRQRRFSQRSFRLPAPRTLARFLAAAQAAVRLPGEITVLLTGDDAIRRLNRKFRGKNRPTDVLSFPAASMHGSEKIAGDLAISVASARRQAIEQGHALSTEIKVLMLHGLLHLAGYDHETDQGRMARREAVLRTRLGLPHGLIERAVSPDLSRAKTGRAPKMASGPGTRAGKP